MSYASIQAVLADQTGTETDKAWHTAAMPMSGWTAWHSLWGDMYRTQAIRSLPTTTSTLVICYAVEALPIADRALWNTVTQMLGTLEKTFSPSASDIALMLNVSRPMIYHYREGMEPSLENKRRLQTLADLADEFSGFVSKPIKTLLKVRQPEGRTLLEFLCDEHLDVNALRHVLGRNLRKADQEVRNDLATALKRGETAQQRHDIVRERHKTGKPVYIGDPDSPGKLIQLRPGGRKVRGQMVNRRFVPDEE